MFIARLKTDSVRLTDPYVAATVKYLRSIPASGEPPKAVRCYIAGGIGVRCYAPVRPTEDLDVFFEGGKVIIPPNTMIDVVSRGAKQSLYFDHQYNPSFGLLHENFDRRAVPLVPNQRGQLRLYVLHPVDLALSKVSRLEDHDRKDIQALAMLGAFDREAFMRLGGEALKDMIGNRAFGLMNLKEAAELIPEVKPRARNRPGRTRSE